MVLRSGTNYREGVTLNQHYENLPDSSLNHFNGSNFFWV